MMDYFCGWYFKCQSEECTASVIVATHTSDEGKSASIQLITERGAWCVPYSYDKFTLDKRNFEISLGANRLNRHGVRLCLSTPELSAIGYLRFGELSPIAYDIMGPFKYVPFMQCRHSVVSMEHSVNGELWINGEHLVFSNAKGYIEGDRGRSFPKKYAWCHSFFGGGSVMLSVATIPLGVLNFTGIISVIHYRGKEYRLATYLGARLYRAEDGEITVRQRDKVLSVKFIDTPKHPLKAPTKGKMSRIIRESAACRARVSFEKGGVMIFDFESDRVSAEYEL